MASFGTTTNLIAGTITLTNISYCQYWYIQNQDAAPLKVEFPSDTNFGPIILNAALATGSGGGWLDSNEQPYFGDIKLTSTIATAQFGSGTSKLAPIQAQTQTGGRGVQNIRG